ncbi:MAG TPA: glycosyltransferase [Gemmatimonadales bacterium]|jgi:cellulose synthase/poly-beta-1,6-N-acetylglucosamine synthase-like glycosyltransferase
MTSICVWLLVIALAFAAYTYVGYPLLLGVTGLFRRGRPPAALPAEWPPISIVLPVYNEESVVRQTLDNLLRLDYPPDRRQVLVVSDASTDRTDAIVREYAGRGVELLRLPRRGGKTAAENAALPLLRGDIIVTTDASARPERLALKALIASFADPTVGVASGHYVSVARVDGHANHGESWYVGYDMWVRQLETRVAGIPGAAGCFHAVRAPIHLRVLPEDISRDFAAALLAREQGLRTVSVESAVCTVPRVPSLRKEYRRKVRTIVRGWHTLHFKRALLNPFHHGLFAWILASHKVCRWLIPHVALPALVALVCLAQTFWWARWGTGLAATSGLCAVLAWWWPEHRRLPKVVALPAYLVVGNVAALSASVRAIKGERTPVWEPTRREVVRAA